MARTFFTATNTAKQALTGGTAKTALQITAPANQRVAIQQLSVSFDGTVNTNTPVLVQWYRQTSAGTVSGSSAVIKKKDPDIGTALNTTVADGFTAEPTYGDQGPIILIHPQLGVIYPLPLPGIGGEEILAGGTRFGIVCNAPQNVNVVCTIEGEE
jgi:hypothetical protein